MASVDKNMKKNSWLRQHFTINKKLLPLKFTLFFFSASAFSILPYLTIHMKDIGIKVEHIALMYAVLPFTIFLAPPLVGFMADKLGSYTRVLILTLLGSGIFHTVLLFLPSVYEVTTYPETSSFEFMGTSAILKWSKCPSDDNNCPTWTEEWPNEMKFSGCTRSPECSIIDVGVCDLIHPIVCQATNNGTEVSFRHTNVSRKLEVGNDCLETVNTSLLMDTGKTLKFAGIDDIPGCKLTCTKIESKLAACTYTKGNRMVTNILYFIFRYSRVLSQIRMLATMCLACNFVLLHAQTIQMCKVEEENGNAGALGRQYVYEALAQAIISPSVGILMDYIARNYNDGRPNYYVPFFGQDVFLIICIISICMIDMDLNLPKSSGLKGIKQIFSTLDICFFLAVMFVLGNCFGFVETYLFLYLKDEMGAPMKLLGLTITMGALVSIPFLYIGDWIVGKLGNENVFITAFMAYAIRYVGYSYITNAWLAFPFEALEVFTYQLKKVATSRYIGENAPEGLLATLNGLAGGFHYGFGKGTGGLIGGAIIAYTGSIATAFRYFGIAAAVFGFIYFIYEFGYVKLCRKSKSKEEKPNNKDILETLEPFLENGKSNSTIIKS